MGGERGRGGGGEIVSLSDPSFGSFVSIATKFLTVRTNYPAL